MPGFLPIFMPADMQAELLDNFEPDAINGLDHLPIGKTAKEWFESAVKSYQPAGNHQASSMDTEQCIMQNGALLFDGIHTDVGQSTTRKYLVTVCEQPNAATIYYDGSGIHELPKSAQRASRLFLRNTEGLLMPSEIMPATASWSQPENGQIYFHQRALDYHSAALVALGVRRVRFQMDVPIAKN